MVRCKYNIYRESTIHQHILCVQYVYVSDRLNGCSRLDMTYDWLPHRWSISMHVFSFGISPVVYCCIGVSIEIQIFIYFICRGAARCCSWTVVTIQIKEWCVDCSEVQRGCILVVLICLLSIGNFSANYFGSDAECERSV